MSTQVVSIGYEGRTVDELVRILREAHVTTLLDLRAVPLSRKPGFSKKALASRLAGEGIAYINLPEAGNPYRTQGDRGMCLQLYSMYLRENPSIVDLVIAALAEPATAVLCYERQHNCCHRSILLQALQERIGVRVIKFE